MTQVNELDKFPYPFTDRVYRYTNNSVLLDPPNSINITPKYKKEIELKRNLLKKHPERCYQSLQHSYDGQWEIVELVIEHLIKYYPELFSLHVKGDCWKFHNKILDEKYQFILGDLSTVETEPLNFIGRHVQEDLIFMGHRDDDLFLDAGQLCFPSNWSLAFKLGMSFTEIHQPIPQFNENSLDNRILQFLKNIEIGNPWTRKNWSLMAGNNLDTHLESFDQWGKERLKVNKDNVGELVHLRVEVQNLFRLPKSNGILFTIHSHLLSLEKFVSKREWLEQFYFLIRELPDHIIDYKGLSLYKDAVEAYLEKKLVELGSKGYE